jgi:DNA-binding SARP family transcriptional activator
MTAMAEPTQPARPQLRLLDGFEYEDAGRRVELPLGTQRLVAFLAFQERPLLRTYVAGCLWLDKSSERSYANLRSALWRLRRPAARLIEVRGQHLTLSPEVGVDVHRVVGTARALLSGCATSDSALLLCGDLLPDWYDDWVVVERERLRQLRLHALEAYCVRLTKAGRFADAIDAAMAAVTAEPLRESAYRVLIAAHLAEGNTAEAVHQYVRYRDLVCQALDIEPSKRLTAMVADAIDLDIVDAWGGQRRAS